MALAAALLTTRVVGFVPASLALCEARKVARTRFSADSGLSAGPTEDEIDQDTGALREQMGAFWRAQGLNGARAKAVLELAEVGARPCAAAQHVNAL